MFSVIISIVVIMFITKLWSFWLVFLFRIILNKVLLFCFSSIIFSILFNSLNFVSWVLFGKVFWAVFLVA